MLFATMSMLAKNVRFRRVFACGASKKGFRLTFSLTIMVQRDNVGDALNTPKPYGQVATGTQGQQRQDALSFVGSLF
ncbi:hypothetical protein IMS62_11430 [Janthinobacterium sp. GW458P]|uniref:hypothetical protein n=1 Tax=Janthinobacterium sp. GW458P TaxID=1981504 RepID=UPI0011246D70|nr:hypothetical protein [Janthinobacterium sp. GW458P]MBE3025288.1 hypothetical protein [Janthinobacterium sp. GW458P]